jgi:hypothetical protein
LKPFINKKLILQKEPTSNFKATQSKAKQSNENEQDQHRNKDQDRHKRQTFLQSVPRRR